MEKQYGPGKKARSLKLLCKCTASKKTYACEYKGNPHTLSGAYNKNAVKFYKDVAQFAASKESELLLNACMHTET